MDNKDLYSILEIPRDANEDDIKSSYRRLALKYHPDTNNGGEKLEERFKEISEAYSILGDENKRKRYDLNGYSLLNEDYSPGTRYGFRGRRGRFNGSGCMGRGMGMGACFNQEEPGWGRAFRHPFSKYQFDRGNVHEILMTKDEALKGAEKAIDIAQGKKSNRVRVKTPAHLKDGDFLIMKNRVNGRMGRGYLSNGQDP